MGSPTVVPDRRLASTPRHPGSGLTGGVQLDVIHIIGVAPSILEGGFYAPSLQETRLCHQGSIPSISIDRTSDHLTIGSVTIHTRRSLSLWKNARSAWSFVRERVVRHGRGGCISRLPGTFRSLRILLFSAPIHRDRCFCEDTMGERFSG